VRPGGAVTCGRQARRCRTAAARRLLKIESENPHSWITIAAVATRLLRQEEALEAYQQAARLKPEEVQLQMSIGHVHKTLGRRAESEAAYKAALAMAPGTAEAYWSLADLKNYSFSDSELAAMRQLLDHTGVERASAAQLHFALGKAFEQRQQYAGAFSHYARGNALRRLVERRTARIRAFFARLAGSGDQSAAPIFIVGLPRSGSTLVEQILASHSRVEGTMELPNIISITHQFDDLLASRYLQETAALRTGCERFTDKLPHNFSHLARKPIRNSAQCPSGALHEAAIRLFFLLGGALLNQSLGWLFLGFFLAIHALAHVDCSWIVHC
jgi:tetratricopeptide (TPR) repeat protein